MLPTTMHVIASVSPEHVRTLQELIRDNSELALYHVRAMGDDLVAIVNAHRNTAVAARNDKEARVLAALLRIPD